MLAFLERFKDQQITSEFLAGSVGTHPVVVRRVLTQLKAAGLVSSQKGPQGGFALARPVSEITLLDVYTALKPEQASTIFALHEKPHPDCPVGGVIQGVLIREFDEVQAAMEAALGQITISRVLKDIGNANASKTKHNAVNL